VVVVRSRAAVVFGIALALGACRLIADDHELYYQAPIDGGCVSVVLPASGNGRIRFVNVGTRGTTDFCVRASGTSSWGAPIFYAGNAECDTGLAYATATVPFAVGVGEIDVEAIPAGKACAATPTAMATEIAIGDSTTGAPVITVIRMGGESTAERIEALPEDGSGTPDDSVRVRFVNAIDGTQAIQIGFTTAATLPATIPAPGLPAPISPGGVEPSTMDETPLGVVDSAGYTHELSQEAPVGAAFQGETSALFAFTNPSDPDSRTVFAIGNASDNAHPLRGLSCDEDVLLASDGGVASGAQAVLESCSLSDLPTLAIDTFEVDLHGPISPGFESDRRQPIYDLIAARMTDLMCVTNVDRQTDKMAIAAAASTSDAGAHFPYAFFPNPPTTLDTQPTDPTEIDGAAPPPAPTAPPCNGIPQADVDAIYACIDAKCSSTGDNTGTIGTTNCLAQACIIPLSALFHKGPQEDACFDCIAYYAVSSPDTLAHGETECTQDSRQPFGFDGQTAEMILSRYPLANQQVFVLPSTGFRKAVLYAEVQLEDQPIDFYCTSLAAGGLDSTVPYTGDYGNDAVTALPDGGQLVENGWEDEANDQVRKVIEFVRTNSEKTKHPAILTGTWLSSILATDDAGTVLVGSSEPEVMAALDVSLGGAFTRAEPPGYVPICDYCPSPTNVYNGPPPGAQFLTTFLDGFEPSEVTEDSVWGTGNIVTLQSIAYQPAPQGGMGPISTTFPRLVRVVRPRPP
jgi:hypothetical protein